MFLLLDKLFILFSMCLFCNLLDLEFMCVFMVVMIVFVFFSRILVLILVEFCVEFFGDDKFFFFDIDVIFDLFLNFVWEIDLVFVFL